jgi:transcriptional regulator GlxA family with amidase domain
MDVKRKIAFFVPDKVHVLDLCGPVQVFYEANCYGAQYELVYFSLGRNTIGAAGLPFPALQPFHKTILREDDIIFIPGADMSYLRSKTLKGEQRFFNWLAKNYQAGVNICTVCTGAFILAATGLLDGKQCTTHWKRIAELKNSYPGLRIVDNILFTRENRLYTSAGVTAGVDLALSIVEEHYGPLFTNKVCRELLVYHRRNGGQTQQNVYLDHRNHLHASIHAVQDWLIENLDKKRTIAELASLANMSARNLARVFKKVTGLTINQYTRALRLEKLRTIKPGAHLKKDALAGQIGYKSARQLRRIQNEKPAKG